MAVPPCDVAAPVLGTVTPSNCSWSVRGKVQLSGLPQNWILNIRRNGIENKTISGVGGEYLVTQLDGGSTYSFSVTDTDSQCTSAESAAYIPINYCDFYVLSLTGTYVDNNNDGIVNLGDVITCTAVFNTPTGNGTYETHVNSIDAIDPNHEYTNYSPYNISIPGNSSATFTSTHVIRQRDINLGFAFIESIITFKHGASIDTAIATTTVPLATGDGLKLQAFIDTNANGTRDFGELNFGHALFHYERNNDGIEHHLITNGTHVIQESDPSATYDISLTTEAGFESQYTIGTTNFNAVTVAAGSGITTLDFPVVAVPFYDVAIAISRYDSPRPGFTYVNSINYTNKGSVVIPLGTISFTHDGVLYMPFPPMFATPTPTGFTYTFYNLYPNETRRLTAQMSVPTIPTVNLGDMVTNSATISIAQTETDLTNNTKTVTHEIVGSFDPNDKSEIHNGTVQMDSFSEQDYLEYTICFENTGTASTVFFRIEDELDNKLDETTLRMVAASHDYILERNGNLLVWRFYHMLPPSNGSATIGHGFVTFQVKPKPGYATGDIIPNTADIYFDFNPAIVTNTVETEFVAPLGVSGYEAGTIMVYPNPAKDILNIDSKDKPFETVTVADLLGKTVLAQTVNETHTSIDLSPLANGLYLVKVDAGDKTQIFKIAKK